MQLKDRLFAVICAAVLTAPAFGDRQASEDEPTIRKGTLVIAGGALRAETGEVWRRFLSERKGEGPIIVIPSASGAPSTSANAVAKTLVRYGVEPENVLTAPLALLDDEATTDIDESDWRENAESAEVIALVEKASAIWFTGGDQARTIELLMSEDGTDSSVLSAIRAANRNGVTIGGSSAGAAVMSSPMIVRGDSMAALTGASDLEPLKLGTGFGIFDYGVVDQHFGERARLGRLAVAVMDPLHPHRRGFGIDENTALIVMSDGRAQVLGTGYVTVLNGDAAKVSKTSQGALRATGFEIGLAAAGDIIDLATLAIQPAWGREATLGREYVSDPLPEGGGPSLPGHSLFYLLGDGLLDNSGATSVSAVSFLLSGEAVQFDFQQTEHAQGYWGRHEDGIGRYTISGVGFDITPQMVRLEPAE